MLYQPWLLRRRETFRSEVAMSSKLLKAGMSREPAVKTRHAAFAQCKRRIRGVLDLGHGGASDAREERKLGAVELPVRKLFR